MQRLRDLNPLHERFGYPGLVVAGVAALLLGLLLRSDIFLGIVDFALELLGWAGILGGAAIAAAGVVAYGSERGWWDGLIERSGQSGKRLPMVRGLSSSALFVLVLLFFFLPWMTISCFDEEVLTLSGADMMGVTEIDGIPSEVGGGDYGMGDALGSEAALLYLAALLAVAGAALFFLPERQGRYIRAGVAAAGLLCMLVFLYLTLSSVASERGVGIGELEEAGVGIGWEYGLWLTLLAFVAVVGCTPVRAAAGHSQLGPAIRYGMTSCDLIIDRAPSMDRLLSEEERSWKRKTIAALMSGLRRQGRHGQLRT